MKKTTKESIDDILEKFQEHEKSADIKNRELLRDSIYFNTPKIIEDIIYERYGREVRVSKIIRDKYGYEAEYFWNYLNKERHSLEDSISEVQVYIFYFSELLFMVECEYNPFPQIFKISENIEWKHKETKFKYYPGLIVARKSSLEGNIYEIAHITKGYEQRNTHFVYSIKKLSVGSIYTMKIDSEFMVLDGVNTNTTRLVSSSEKIISPYSFGEHGRLLNCIYNIMKKYNMSIIDLMDGEGMLNENEFSLLIEEFNSLSSHKEAIACALYFKFSDQKFIEKNIKSQTSPIIYEFWTKNPREKAISFYEKAKLEKFLRLTKWFDKKIKQKENEKFSLFLAATNEYLCKVDSNFKIDEVFKSNNLFDSKYTQKKIVMKKEYISTSEKLKLIESFGELLNSSKEILVNSQLNHDGLRKEQINGLEHSIRNSVTVIIGQAGSGKTRLSASIIKELDRLGENHVFIAKTNKAARVIEELDVELRSVLKHELNYDTIRSFITNFNGEFSKIDNVIIDESSMIDDSEWEDMLSILSVKKRVILIGDGKQLPPMHSVGLFDYFLNNTQLNRIELKFNGRQATESLKQLVETFRNQNKFLADSNVIEQYRGYEDFKDKLNYLAKKEYLFLTPINYGLYGVQAILESFSTTNIRPGDKMIVIDAPSKPRAVYIGKRLTIEKVEGDKYYFSERERQKYIIAYESDGWSFVDGKLVFNWKDKNVPLPFTHASVMSIHNSQGSSIDNVCLIIPPNYRFDQRMMYTALSRVKKKLKILTSEFNIENILEKQNRGKIVFKSGDIFVEWNDESTQVNEK